jgi:RimJ/RimL family protein N-acetyltransferase
VKPLAYFLETDRLILREFQESDFEDVYEYASNPEVARFTIRGVINEQETREFLKRQIHHQSEDPRRIFDFALVLKDSIRLIGACGLHLNAGIKDALMGYVLNRKYWNQGYMTEAAKRIVQFGFEELGLKRIYASCDPANTASVRIMEKIGMKFEGRQREEKFTRGNWRLSLLYAILETQWRR